MSLYSHLLAEEEVYKLNDDKSITEVPYELVTTTDDGLKIIELCNNNIKYVCIYKL